MNDEFARKVRSAAVAGWWTLLIAGGFGVVNWLVYLIIIHTQPDWMLAFWGGVRQPSCTPAGTIANPWALTWDSIQFVWLCMTALFKVLIWVLALLAIWLSLWARALRKA